MKKRLVLLIVIFTFLAGFQAFAEDSVRVSSADLQALIRRVERLEQQQAQTGVSPQMGIAPAGTQKKGLRPEVDAETGATVKKVGNGNGRLTFGGYGEATFLFEQLPALWQESREIQGRPLRRVRFAARSLLYRI